MGVQWIYNVDQLSDLLATRRSKEGPGAGLEFLDPPQSPFLPGYAAGRHSPYGEGTMVLLRSLALNGGLDCLAYGRLYAETFGESFDGYRNASTTVGCHAGVAAGCAWARWTVGCFAGVGSRCRSSLPRSQGQ